MRMIKSRLLNFLPSLQHFISLVILTLFIFSYSGITHAQTGEILQEKSEVLKAKVQSINKTTHEQLGWDKDVLITVQHISAKLLDGADKGKIVVLENEFTELKVGDRIYVNHVTDFYDTESYRFHERDRMGSIALVIGFFVLILIAFGGMQGLRSFIALVGSLFAIMFILVPAILAGYSPVLVSVGVASSILFMALFFTHGFNRGSAVAFVGTVSAVIITGILAYYAIDITHLTGLTDDEHTYLKFNTGGNLDFLGLLLGAIIIGALGALDDIAVTQVAVVRELFATDTTQHFMQVYTKAMRVGKEHVGALVNTLILAYVGMSLPLLLLYAQASDNAMPFINLEIFATEIVRMMVGSIGLILAVPITTILAVYFMKDAKELPKSFGHSHGH